MTASLPLHSPSLSAAIADRVRLGILQGQWLPGQELNDGAIATDLGVSRTPVREAFKQLCHEGLLTAHPLQGMTVTVLSTAQVQEALRLRDVLHCQLEQHPELQDGLTPRMLAMVEQRIALSQLPVFQAQ